MTQVGRGYALFTLILHVDGIHDRKPITDVEIGQRSIRVCHTVNITRQLGRKIYWNPESGHFTGDAEANDHVTRRQGI